MDFLADSKKTEKKSIQNNHHTDTPWVVLLIDDDDQILQVSLLALRNFQYRGRGLELITASSGSEARKIFDSRNDIALAIVDVVMETDCAGLELIKYIREELNNRITRLVLRTGQAGMAPEDFVIQEYEIDGYKEKTELTTQKLRTLLYSMLRSYSDLCTIKEQKIGLGKVIEASARVQKAKTLNTFSTAVLEQLTSLLKVDASAFYCIVPQDFDGSGSRLLTLAATSEYVAVYPFVTFDALPDKVAARCQAVIEEKKTKHYPDAHIFYSHSDEKLSSLLYLELNTSLMDLDRQLLNIYMQNIALTFERLNLMADLQETSKEIVFNMANAVEARSKETGAHVQRVALVTEKLATYYGLDNQEIALLKYASSLHDVGKVMIPDKVLNKPGKLNAVEWSEMQKHAEYGVQILCKSKRKLIYRAKEIAATHHEKWDGSGYPNRLSGDDIPIFGRITALADVFDALGSKRCYKDAWGTDDIKTELLAQKGKHFDPKLVDIMLTHWEEFVSVRDTYPD